MRYLTLSVLALHLSSMPSGQEPVFDLSDKDCRDEVLISVVEGARIYASCAQSGSERIMRVSVSNLADAKMGQLRDFSIGFCAPSVIGASAQSGWIAKNRRRRPPQCHLVVSRWFGRESRDPVASQSGRVYRAPQAGLEAISIRLRLVGRVEHCRANHNSRLLMRTASAEPPCGYAARRSDRQIRWKFGW